MILNNGLMMQQKLGLAGNTAQSGNFTKNNCGTGYYGSTVTYTIPANTYFAATQAAANVLAMSAVVAGGQAYANTNGNCLLIPAVTISNASLAPNSTGVYHSINLYVGCSISNFNYPYSYTSFRLTSTGGADITLYSYDPNYAQAGFIDTLYLAPDGETQYSFTLEIRVHSTAGQVTSPYYMYYN